MLGKTFIVLVIFLLVSTSVYANEAQEKPKAKGVEVVTEAAAALVQKSTAILSLDLEVDLSAKKTVPKDQYTLNAIGQRVPRATVLKGENRGK